ncbi:uncharacterized protein LOC108625503, partial [Ceratina calcarata]|uniref:Uncharacterized protein LOC108625503 n=1 Tax=Ceratina calcarata TaxID=156304 RepID=A0AAJ7J0C4_9HYME
MYHNCCVPGCDDRKSTRHRFPNPIKDENRFKQWLQLVGNEKILNMDPARVFRNYRVCHEHFTPEDKSSNSFLKRTTIPSRNLPQIIKQEPSTSCNLELGFQHEELVSSTSKSFNPDETVVQKSSTD